jgi:hypothetical protein
VGGSGEPLQHHGAKMEVRLGRNDEKGARWRCSPRKGVSNDVSSRFWRGRRFFGDRCGQEVMGGAVGVGVWSGWGKKRVWGKRNG